MENMKMNEFENSLKKENYTTPVMEVIPYDQDDVILTSYEYPGEEDEF